MNIAWVVGGCAALGLLVNAGMIGFAWGSLKANQDNQATQLRLLLETILRIEARLSAIESKR